MISIFRCYTGFLTSLFLFGVNFSSPAQKVIEVKYEQDQKGVYVFSCVNYAYCNYILNVGFTTFTNVKSDHTLPFHAEVRPGYNKLFNITPIDPQAPVQIKFQ